jgi:hypothetical protein
MKKTFTLLVSSLFTASLFAFDGSSLSISTVSNKMNLQVEVDGRKIRMNDNTITLQQLSDGYHQVKIVRETKRRGGGFFDFGKKRGETLFNSTVFLRRGFAMDIIVSRSGKVFTDEVRIDRFDNMYDDEKDADYDDEEDFNHGNNNGYGNVMSGREFEQVKDQIRKEWQESNRLLSAKTITDRYSFTTQQVKELMMLFTFDKNKLEIAKYAFRKTIDKQNYHQLNSEFSFRSTADELDRFMRESR